MNEFRCKAITVVAAALLFGCATAPEPPKQQSIPMATFVRQALKNELNSPQMQRMVEQDRARESADLACLSPEQRKEFTERREAEIKKIYAASTDLLLQAAQNRDPATRQKREAAHEALQKCEANLPADSDKSLRCEEERSKFTKLNAPVAEIQDASRIFMDVTKNASLARAQLRAEYPACESGSNATVPK